MVRKSLVLGMLLVGCNNENSLADKTDPNADGALDTASDPTTGNSGGDTDGDPYWNTQTDTWSGSDDTPTWIWDSGDTDATPPGTPSGGTGSTTGDGTPTAPTNPTEPTNPTDPTSPPGTGSVPGTSTPTGTGIIVPPIGSTPTPPGSGTVSPPTGTPTNGTTTGSSPPTGTTSPPGGTTTPTGPGTGTTTGPTTSPPGGTTTPDTGLPTTIPTVPDTGLTDQEICERAAALAGYLDAWQTANDGRVYYCHSSSGTNYVFVESDISSCLPHLNHNYDVFPTTGCDS